MHIHLVRLLVVVENEVVALPMETVQKRRAKYHWFACSLARSLARLFDGAWFAFDD